MNRANGDDVAAIGVTATPMMPPAAIHSHAERLPFPIHAAAASADASARNPHVINQPYEPIA